jgi:predicted DNA-binding transcriptional regulator YafY
MSVLLDKLGRKGHEPGSLELTRGSGSGHFPLARLLHLLSLLQSESCPNARRLAELCEVSRRTIYRDLATLTSAGILIVYRSDRQGYQLARDFFLQPPKLEEREILALLLMSRQWNAGELLGLYREANSAVDKLLRSLPDPPRSRLLVAADAVGPARDVASDRQSLISERLAVTNQVLESLAVRKKIRLWIREGGGQEIETTRMELYRLTWHGQRWCLVGRSSRHCRIILTPLDHVERVEPTDDPYEIPPRFNLERCLSQLGDPSVSLSG